MGRRQHQPQRHHPRGRIERLGLNGSGTTFPVPTNRASSFSIVSLTTGPDGNVWFDANYDPSFTDNQVVIGKVTPSGAVTEFPPIPLPSTEGALADTIVSGPDGDLWFGYTVGNQKIKGFESQNFIGQVTTSGAVTLFPVSKMGSKSPLLLDSLASGADGNIWFTEGLIKPFVFGRLSPSGAVTTFPFGKGKVLAGMVANGSTDNLVAMAVEGNFQGGFHDLVYSVTTADAFTPYKIPKAISYSPMRYLGSADGSLWFTDGSAALKLVQIASTGAVTSYKFLGGQNHLSDSMAVGQDGNLYVLDDTLGDTAVTTTTIYRVTPGELVPLR